MSRGARRLYRACLSAFPAAFRERHGEAMEATFADLLDDARVHRGRAAAARLVAAECAVAVGRGLGERARGARSGRWLGGVAGDLRFAVRTLARSPGYTAVAVVTLALGIGAGTAAFGVLRGVLFEPLPFPEPGRLFAVREVDDEGEALWTSVTNYRDWADASARDWTALAAAAPPRRETVLAGGGALRARLQPVTTSWFAAAGIEPALGRALDPSGDAPGGEVEAVVSHAFWSTVLGGERDLARLTVGVGTATLPVVGVMPPGFALLGTADVWVPLLSDPGLPSNRGSHGYRVVGRLAPGVDPASADAALDALMGSLAAAYPDEVTGSSVRLTPLRDLVVGDAGRGLWILMAASALVLLVACVNLAGSGLARAAARETELAVRASLGAGRGRLVRQLVTEAGVLSLAGAVAGVGLALALLALVRRQAPSALPRVEALTLDAPALAWAALAAALTTAVVGLVPALRVTAPARRLRGARRTAPWAWLVGLETGLSLVLLVGSGLLLRTLWTITHTDAGFRVEDVLVADVTLPRGAYPDPGEAGRFYDDLVEAVRSSPAVAGAGAVTLLPTFAGSWVGPFTRDDGTTTEGFAAHYRLVTPGYFEALDIRLLEGRLLTAADRAGEPHVAVVNGSMARRFWPGESPVGRRIHLGGMDPYRDDWITIVGVVREARHWSREAGTQPEYYIPVAQRPLVAWLAGMTVAVVPRPGASAGAATALREAARRLDPDVPVEVEPLERRLARSWSDRTFQAWLLGGFALVALALASVGIWGVVAYTVARGTREVGLRLALGAAPAEARRTVQRRSLVPAVAGLAVGLAVALALSGAMEGLLFGVRPLDPLTYAVVTALLLGVATLASWLPARRASRVDPVAALRSE